MSPIVVWPIALGTLWLTTGLAAAQPSPAPIGSPPPSPPAGEPAPAPPAAAPVAVRTAEPAADSGRPTELAFGIGVGYAFPTSLQTPNTTSARLRLANGLTFEPQLVLALSSNDADPGTGGTTNNKQSELTLGSLVRYPLRVHRKVDFEGIGRAAISSQTSDPDGDDNNRTITALNIGYGIGLAYWITRHWNLSLTATNPLITYVRTRQETAATTTTDKTTTIGLVFDPTVALMIHLYD